MIWERDSAKAYPDGMAEVGLATLVIGVLVLADPTRLQAAIEKLRELMAWLAE